MVKGVRDRSTGQDGASHSSSDIRLTARDRSVVSSSSGSAKSTPRKVAVDRNDGSPVHKDSKRAAAGKETFEKESSGKKRSRNAARRPVSWLGRFFYWSVVASIWGFIAVAGLVVYHAAKLPPIDQLSVPKRPPNIAIMAVDGTLVANRGEMGGRTMQLSELPPYLPKAFVSIEDRRFYEHFGIDPIGIARAMLRNITSGGGHLQGGSTLTQQLAKNLFLTQERTASRKIQEAILALWLERNYSKDQILELYLNRVYFGSGAYGVEAAAQRYFGKSAKHVSLAEAAILGGLVQSPSRLAPNRNPTGAQARAELVLSAMQREGYVSEDMVRLAQANPAKANRASGAGSSNYAADYVMDVLDDFIGTLDKDVIVTTTLDPALQSMGERALVDELMQRGEKFGVSQGAFVAMTPDGAIKALVGGKSYAESQFNRVIAAKRQPGSSFKPIVFLTALERGLTPDTIRDDAPLSIKGWNPENYSRKYAGPVSLKNALAQSLNTVSVRLCLEVGPKAVVSTAARLGIRSKLEPNASIALGTSEVSPLEMVGAYASFANGGLGVLPYVITEVKTREGEIVYVRSGGGIGRVISTEHVGMMNVMMHETMVTGTARKATIPGWETAGKTGTSQDFRDAWFVGYTSTLVAGIWLGNDDGSPTKHLSGATLPTDIWQKFMLAALKGMKPQPLPGLNSSWSLDIPALLGLSSKDDAAPADEPMVEPSRSKNEFMRTPALPQSNLVPPASVPQVQAPLVSVPQVPVPQVPVPAPVRSNPDGRPLQIVPQSSSGSVMAPPQDVRGPVGRAQDPRELRPPAMVGGSTETARQPARREPSVFDRLFGG